MLDDLIQDVKVNINNLFDGDLILFGSYARGDFTSESDINLCVIYNKKLKSDCDIVDAVGKLINEILLKYDVFISILYKSKFEYNLLSECLPLYMNVKKEGIKF